MDIFQIIRQFGKTITMADLLCAIGLILFGIWLLKTSWGRNALADSIPRGNNMPFYLPFIPLFIWFGATSLAVSIVPRIIGDLQGWEGAFLDNLILSIGAITAIATIIFLARSSFARRLKGFGLNIKTVHKDFLAAFVNLLAIYPLVMAVIILTVSIGKLIYGQDFQVQQHEELQLLTAYPQFPLRIIVVVLAVIISPLLEEMLFRGLFQTMIRSILEVPNPRFSIRNAAWPSILISSILFAIIHVDTGHWPALFVLAVCLGYAYEKSGSLFRPIFIHSFFNAASIIAVLGQ